MKCILAAGTQFDSKITRVESKAISKSTLKKKQDPCLPSSIKYDSRYFEETAHSVQDIRISGKFVPRQEGQRIDGIVFPFTCRLFCLGPISGTDGGVEGAKNVF